MKLEGGKHKNFKSPSLKRLKTQLHTQSFRKETERNLASDAIKVKQILQQKRIESRVTEFPRNDDAVDLILTRHIGIKESMPGSGQWRMLTDKHDACWFCDQWVYSLIFWDEATISKNARAKTNSYLCSKLISQVERINPQFRQVEQDGESMVSHSSFFSESDQSPDLQQCNTIKMGPLIQVESGNSSILDMKDPLIFGEFTNWKPVKMQKLSDFVLALHKKYFNHQG